MFRARKKYSEKTKKMKERNRESCSALFLSLSLSFSFFFLSNLFSRIVFCLSPCFFFVAWFTHLASLSSHLFLSHSLFPFSSFLPFSAFIHLSFSLYFFAPVSLFADARSSTFSSLCFPFLLRSAPPVTGALLRRQIETGKDRQRRKVTWE